GNYSGFLFGRGRQHEAVALRERALALVTPQDGPLILELWFYGYAHTIPGSREDALRQVQALIVKGVRSPGWDLSLNVSRAEADGHPEAGWLRTLADVIAEGAPASALDAWPAWSQAGMSDEAQRSVPVKEEAPPPRRRRRGG
ncbi:MAG TPA: hypothetical protein VNX21_00075, partial [Candidatus Thermoplasmatota archaeon]|nr:hypothetical protein [Candidatus Thermoplasmatota archaeon]